MASYLAKSFRSVNMLSLEIKDNFLSDFLAKEADSLLSAFILFVAPEIVDKSDVAQYREGRLERLIFLSDNIIKIVKVFERLKLTAIASSLSCQRDLLAFKYFLINHRRPEMLAAKKTQKSRPVAKLKSRPEPEPAIEIEEKESLNKIQVKILDMLTKAGRLKNQDLFSELNNMSPRTIRRNLSDMISKNLITRTANGKKVFYEVSAKK